MATRGPRARKAKDKETSGLLEALRFIALAQNDTVRHCVIKSGWCVASDGILTIGHKIAETLDAYPQTDRLIAALERCGEGVAITQLDSGRLSVKSGPLRAVIPCIDDVQIVWPSPSLAPLLPSFLVGVQAIAHIAADAGPTVDTVSLLVKGKTICATNRAVMVEYWHGNDMPPDIMLPKQAATALIKCGKTPVSFGWEPQRSITFYFADESFIKTQLFEDKYPNFDSVFAKEVAGFQLPVPDKLFEAVRLIGDFSDCNRIKFESNLLKTVNRDSEGAEHDVKGLIEGPMFDIKNLELIAPLAKTMAINLSWPAAYFYGENLRGAISYYTHVF